ncbi:Hypothetical_protein [Hexamita inflata]|uniref:Hypothetical_protein n=1 Tax=Hexamita inflata TaxID=28002 RepID=A0AA86QT75_9EUKA|nr:Hypothetical protein HINF_LOCUS50292 [Hexamita inflata]
MEPYIHKNQISSFRAAASDDNQLNARQFKLILGQPGKDCELLGLCFMSKLPESTSGLQSKYRPFLVLVRGLLISDYVVPEEIEDRVWVSLNHPCECSGLFRQPKVRSQYFKQIQIIVTQSTAFCSYFSLIAECSACIRAVLSKELYRMHLHSPGPDGIRNTTVHFVSQLIQCLPAKSAKMQGNVGFPRNSDVRFQNLCTSETEPQIILNQEIAECSATSIHRNKQLRNYRYFPNFVQSYKLECG